MKLVLPGSHAPGHPNVLLNGDTDSDHSFSQLSVHKALTCPEGRSARALAPSLFGE